MERETERKLDGTCGNKAVNLTAGCTNYSSNLGVPSGQGSHECPGGQDGFLLNPAFGPAGAGISSISITPWQCFWGDAVTHVSQSLAGLPL